MKRTSLFNIVVGVFAFFAFIRLGMVHKPTIQELLSSTLSQEDADDVAGRAKQEWMQLRDPYSNAIPSDIRSKELAYAKSLPSVDVVAKSRLEKEQVLSWTFRGPINQGGRTRALAYDISDGTGNTILAGGVSGGMWRSTNGGTSWSRTSTLADSVQSVSCLAQDPRVGHQGIWYYGTGELKGNSASGGGGNALYTGDGVYKSTDDGVTWHKLTSIASWTPQGFDVTTDFVWDVVVDPTNGNVYAATYGEIDRSTDGGSTWNPTLPSTSAFSRYTDVAVTSTGIFYAVMSSDGSDAGIYRSTTGALNSWSNITPLAWPSSYDRIVLAVAPSNQNVVYFLGETPNSGYVDTSSGDWTSFWKYADNGSGTGTWSDRSANLPYFPGGQNVGNFQHQHSYDLVMKVKPDNQNFVFIGGTNLYRSSDGFATKLNTAWIGGYATANDVSQYANHHPDQHSMTFKPGSPGILVSGHDGGVSETTNDSASTVSWALLNNGYLTSQFYSVAIDMSVAGDQTVIGGMQDNGHLFSNTTSGATPWVKMPFGGDGGVTAIANGKSSYYLCTQNGDVERVLLDANGALLDFAGVKPSGGSDFLFTTPYVLDPTNADIMYLAAGSDLWRNSDLTGIPTATHGGSQNPTSVNWTDLTNAAAAGHYITAFGISTAPANRLYYGTDSSQVFRLNNANTATSTTNPTNITGSNFPAAATVGGAYVSCIAVNPRNADTAIVVFSNYSILSLFLTTNGGTNWTSISGNLEQNPDGSGNGPSCRWATILPKSPGVLVYVATSTGVYSTSAFSGVSTVWALEGASVIGNVVATMVISRPSDGVVVAATHGNGVFGAQAVTAVQSQASLSPRSFELSQNYPNPFNPSTSIQYILPKTGSIKLTVFDIAGRQITTLVEGVKAAGTYTAEWNGKTKDGMQVSSGIYFYRLDAPGYSATRKLVMLK